MVIVDHEVTESTEKVYAIIFYLYLCVLSVFAVNLSTVITFKKAISTVLPLEWKVFLLIWVVLC